MRRLVAGVAPFVLVVAVYAVVVGLDASVAPAPAATSAPAMSAPSTSSSTSVPLAVGAWDALPSDDAVALGVLAAIPTTTTTTTTTTVPAPVPPSVPAAPHPAPVPPLPARVGGSLEDLICSYGWDCARALAVARCESRLDPAAVGGAGERGLFQIHPVHAAWLGPRWDALFDPVVNVAVAHEMWRTQGWRPWSCAR